MRSWTSGGTVVNDGDMMFSTSGSKTRRAFVKLDTTPVQRASNLAHTTLFVSSLGWGDCDLGGKTTDFG